MGDEGEEGCEDSRSENGPRSVKSLQNEMYGAEQGKKFLQATKNRKTVKVEEYFRRSPDVIADAV